MQITNTANGNTAYGKTVDSCESCRDNDIGMNDSALWKSYFSSAQFPIQICRQGYLRSLLVPALVL